MHRLARIQQDFENVTGKEAMGQHTDNGDRFLIFRSSPGDDLVDWNSGVSVRPSIRPYVHKVFPISI